jgi:hypothetical protein
LYEINKALVFEINPQCDWFSLCECIFTVAADISLGQQKKNNRRCQYLLSLGEEMVKRDIRKRVDSGNVPDILAGS